MILHYRDHMVSVVTQGGNTHRPQQLGYHTVHRKGIIIDLNNYGDAWQHYLCNSLMAQTVSEKFGEVLQTRSSSAPIKCVIVRLLLLFRLTNFAN